MVKIKFTAYASTENAQSFIFMELTSGREVGNQYSDI